MGKDMTWEGWTIFGILMAVFLLKDLIGGLKLVILSGKNWHTYTKRLRFLFGGIMICCITMYIIYVSAIYNKAIATTDTEAIYNSVIILFIMEIDSRVFQLIKAYNEGWITKITKQNRETEENSSLKGSNQYTDALSMQMSTNESESCLPNNSLLPKEIDYEVAELQDQLLEQGN